MTAPIDERSSLTSSPRVPETQPDGVPALARAAEPAGHGIMAASALAYAALDLGTNNCRLLIARPSRRGFAVIDAFSRIVRLGEGVGSSGVLSVAAMDRARDALKICRAKLDRHGVRRHRLVATEACRQASNTQAFLDRIAHELGLDIEILSHEAEARLAVSGCASLIEEDAELAVIFDIGGGSSELIWLDMKHQARSNRRRPAPGHRLEAQGCIEAWTSLPLGVVTLSERYGGREVSRATFEAMVEHVQALIAPFEARHNFAARIPMRRVQMLGTSGTVTTLAGVHMGLKRYERSRVDGSWLSVEDIRKVTDALIDMSYAERAAEPCIGPERADLVLAGCAILEALLRRWPVTRVRVADRGLREGILTTLMAEDRV